LTETVWHTAYEYDYTPTQADVTSEKSYLEQQTAAYSFINTGDKFNYGANDATTLAQWFGEDAAGAALADTHGTTYFGFNAVGYIYVPTAGNYTFNLGNSTNKVDDAARITVGGNIVAEQNFAGAFSDYQSTVYLNVGFHAYDLFYFQTGGGFGLTVSETGPDGSVIDFLTTAFLPEPASFAMVAVGMAALGMIRWRSRAAASG
jgi:hypothetical protein